VGREHAVEANQMQPGTRHQRWPRRYMNSSGDMTMWVVPSLEALFSCDIAGVIAF
jgi:hypothetical protein